MAVTPPPGYTPPPTDLPQRGDRATFSNRVDAWVTWFSTVILTQLAAMIASAYANAVDATASAALALGYRDTANSAATAAQAARDLAQGYRDSALTYRDQAAASATAAASSAAGVTASSTTSLTVGNGNKVFTVPAGKQFLVGVPMVAASAGTPTAKMFGSVVSYSGTSLTLNITSFGGTGTFGDWSISPAGNIGATGGTAGGQLTSALDEKKGTDLASAATIDPWSTGGNTMALTGSIKITGVAPAPQPGARRTMVAKGAPVIEASAALIVKGGSTALVAGDEVDIEAETTTQFLITVRRGDGSATAPSSFRNIEVLTSSQPWVAKVSGPHQIILQGAAASAGAAIAISGGAAAASGASTAGGVVKTFNAVAGDSYMLNLGAGGAAVVLSAGSANIAVAGNDATDSTFTGPGVSLTAGGGRKGNATVLASGTATALGAVGGTATGGDANYPGGGSGTATAIAGCAAATGGGAMPYRGLGMSSGTATATTAASNKAAASGGAGVGGKSGNATATTAATASAGGGYAGASPDVTNATGTPGAGTNTTFATVIGPLPLSSPGGAASASGNSGTSASGGGGGATVASTNALSGGTTMGGGGGALATTTGNSDSTTGSSSFGGASGALAVTDTTASFSGIKTVGAGGAAFAIILSK